MQVDPSERAQQRPVSRDEVAGDADLALLGLEKIEHEGVAVYFPPVRPEVQADELKARIAAHQQVLGYLRSQTDVQAHLDLLHSYNETKDTAQTLLGALAVHEGVCTRDLYSQFGINLDD